MTIAELLDRVEVFTRRFVVLTEAQATAAALWGAHTWALEAAQATPYLFICSAEPESGKTRLMEVLHEFVRVPLLTMNISDAALFRAIDAKQPTLFFDEVDSVFSKRAQERGMKDELRALLNAGYRRGQVVYRMGGGNRTSLESFAVFSAKALAGLGTLPPSLASRCVRIELKRRRLTEAVEDFYPQDIAEEASLLREGLEVWAEANLDALRAARPVRIEGVRDRTMEVWRPLLAIAELAGDPWATRARCAAVSLATNDGDEPSLGLLLLEDIRTVFDELKIERLPTTDLVFALARQDESPWGEWWLDAKTHTPNRTASRRLAQLLRPYGIRTNHTVRSGERTAKGYRREDFVDAWERFLPPPRGGVTSVTSVTAQLNTHADVTDVTDVTDGRDGEWLARDGVWRSLEEEPPAFAGEMIDVREETPAA
jgi:Protein of unknown function (DUF3631)